MDLRFLQLKYKNKNEKWQKMLNNSDKPRQGPIKLKYIKGPFGNKNEKSLRICFSFLKIEKEEMTGQYRIRTNSPGDTKNPYFERRQRKIKRTKRRIYPKRP